VTLLSEKIKKMKNKIRKQGNYDLFITSKKHLILSLDQKGWYAVVEGQESDILVASNSDHQKERTSQEGKYFLVEMIDDPDFNDVPHLFLEKADGNFDEWVLPNSLPSSNNKKVRLIRTKKVVNREKVQEHSGASEKEKSPGKENLASKKKSDLYEIAQTQGIKGRSKMGKSELIKEISEK
jgi:hypothetical protein